MWNRIPGLVYYIPKSISLHKVIIFDLDGTLITRRNGKIPKYPDNDSDNWIFLSPDVPSILMQYKNKGFTILIFTNQSRYNEHVQKRIDMVREYLSTEYKIDCSILIATSEEYRKPALSSLQIFRNFEPEELIVCGDAIGNTPYPPYNWSDVDYQFYVNLSRKYQNAKFMSPLEIFPTNIPRLLQEIDEDVVVMVGNPGSGKSSFAHQLAGYTVLTQDELKTVQKMDAAFMKNSKVVIDATNPSIIKRKHWIDLARSRGMSVAIVWMTINGYPFNEVRENPVPDIVYNMYSKHFEEPTEEEGAVVYRAH